MANFRIYNVQLLPNTADEGEVGVVGYKKLFAKFRAETERARKDKNLLNYHRDVGRDAHFGPKEFNVAAGYVWGKFVRYRRTNAVDDLNTNKRLFKEGAKQVGVATQTEMMFIFDCQEHFLAIEEAGSSLPPSADFTDILDGYLRPLSKDLFPKHNLHILLISDRKSLDVVLQKAMAYSKIDLDLTFANGEVENTLDGLKRARIQKLNLTGSPGSDGKISKDLPAFLLDLIHGAIKYGRAKLSYYAAPENGKGEEVKRIYDSGTAPLKFTKRQSADESDANFAERCVEELREIVDGIVPHLSNDKGIDK